MKRLIFIILFIFLCLYILPLGIRPLVIPDEVRYAEIPREMMTSGDWIVPRLNGLLYFEKPVMGYWLNGIAMKIFGENAFSVRISSAVSAGLSALVVFFLAIRFLNNRRMGILATSVFLTFFYFFWLLPGILFPWTFLVPASISGFVQKGVQAPLLRYAVCWFLKRDDIFMLDPGELTYGLKQKGSEARLVTYKQFYKLVRQNSGKQKIALVINQRHYDRMKTSLPEPVFLDSTGKNGFAFILF